MQLPVTLIGLCMQKKSKLILLDDPLSALDAHVGEHHFLFNNAIVVGDDCPDATRILFTHHVHFLPRYNKAVVLEGGEIKHYGKYYADLTEQGVDFAGAVEFDGKEKEAHNERRRT